MSVSIRRLRWLTACFVLGLLVVPQAPAFAARNPEKQSAKIRASVARTHALGASRTVGASKLNESGKLLPVSRAYASRSKPAKKEHLSKKATVLAASAQARTSRSATRLAPVKAPKPVAAVQGAIREPVARQPTKSHSIDGSETSQPSMPSMPSMPQVTDASGSTLAALFKGAFFDGPRNTLRAIRQSPRMFAGSLLAVGLVGVIANHYKIDVTVSLLAASATAVGVQVKQHVGSIRAASGAARWRLVGAEVVWPSLMWGGTGAAGLAVGQTGGMSAAAAGIQAVLLGGDGPGILVMALNPERDGLHAVAAAAIVH